MHHHDGGSDLIGIIPGVLLSIGANALGWIGWTEVQHGAGAILFGILGGVGGWIAKRLMDRVTRKKKQQDNNQEQ